MLDININAKNHPDWDAPGVDEDAKQTWIDAQTDNLMCDAETIRDAIDMMRDSDLEYVGSRAIDTFLFNSPHSSEACERIGIKIATAIKAYATDIAERQWEMINE